MGMEIFQEIGREVEARWSEAGRDPEAFSQIAYDVLSTTPVEERTSLEEILTWAVTTSDDVTHEVNGDSEFGEPPVTVYAGRGFFIEVLVWFDGMPTLHEHVFAGAFRVLAGASCQTTYTFQERGRPSSWAGFGELAPISTRLLGVGDCQSIVPGPSFIHGLFHLDRPSATVVVRTKGIDAYLPQLDYFQTGFSMAFFHKPTAMRRRLDALACLAKQALPSLENSARQLLASSDLHGAFHVLTVLRGRSSSLMRKVAREFRESWGDNMEALLGAVEQKASDFNLLERRRLLSRDEHRFLLGLIVVVPTREDILRLVGERYPGMNPVERVLGWLRELAATPTPAPEMYGPNILGIDLDDVGLALCEGWLRGDPEERTIEGILKDPVLGPPDVGRVHQLAMLLPNTHILRVLLAP